MARPGVDGQVGTGRINAVSGGRSPDHHAMTSALASVSKAADWVLIPVQPEDYGAQGLPQVTRSIELVRRVANTRLAILGLVISIFSGRRTLHQIDAETLRQQYGDLVFAARLPDAAEIPEATMLRKPIAYHKPKDAGSKALAALADELEARLAAAATNAGEAA